MKKKAVIALGGNALIKEDQEGTIYEQFKNTREISKSIVEIIKNDWNIVLTHGNGPQVGAILLQNDLAKDITPSMPLGVCVAESQGLIGYMIQQCLSNALRKDNIKKDVVTLLTQVLVDKNDPSFKDPTKPIGPYYNDKEAEMIKKEGYSIKQKPDGWRIVVPSPDPTQIIEAKTIKKLLDDDIIVISTGGGGMPVIEKKDWGLDGVEAVIDKDLASERLAESIQAELFMILTNVEKVYLNFNTSEQKPINNINLKEIKKHYKNNQFAEGSMAPKILAAIRFLESGGKKVIISHVQKAIDALNGKTGTHITK